MPRNFATPAPTAPTIIPASGGGLLAPRPTAKPLELAGAAAAAAAAENIAAALNFEIAQLGRAATEQEIYSPAK